MTCSLLVAQPHGRFLFCLVFVWIISAFLQITHILILARPPRPTQTFRRGCLFVIVIVVASVVAVIVIVVVVVVYVGRSIRFGLVRQQLGLLPLNNAWKKTN